MYCLSMLQPSILAILTRAAMEVLALRRDKDISALAALITKEKPARVGIITCLMCVCHKYNSQVYYGRSIQITSVAEMFS